MISEGVPFISDGGAVEAPADAVDVEEDEPGDNDDTDTVDVALELEEEEETTDDDDDDDDSVRWCNKVFAMSQITLIPFSGAMLWATRRCWMM